MGCDGTTPSWLMSVDLCGKAVDNFIVETEETVVRIKSFIKSITVRYVGILDTEEFDLVVNDLYQFCLLSDKFVVRIRQHQDLRKCDVGIIKDFIQSIDVLMIRYGRTIEWRQLLVHGDGDKKSILIPMEYICRLPGAIKTIYDNYNPNTCKDHYSAMRQLGLQMTILRANRLKEECYSVSLPKIENWQQLKESLTDDNNYSLGDLKLTLYLWGMTRGSGTISEVSAAEKRIRDVCGCMEAHKENVLAFTRKFKQISERWLQLLAGLECEIPIRGGYIDYHDRITSMSEDAGTLMAQMEVQVVSKLREGCHELCRIRRNRCVSDLEIECFSCQLIDLCVMKWFQIYVQWVGIFASRSSSSYDGIVFDYTERMNGTRLAVARYAPELEEFFVQ